MFSLKDQRMLNDLINRENNEDEWCDVCKAGGSKTVLNFGRHGLLCDECHKE